MSILTTIFVKQFNSPCSVCLSKGFFAAFAALQNCESEKASFFNHVEQLPKNFSVTCAVPCDFETVATLRANSRKSLKFHCFELVQNWGFRDALRWKSLWFSSMQNYEFGNPRSKMLKHQNG